MTTKKKIQDHIPVHNLLISKLIFALNQYNMPKNVFFKYKYLYFDKLMDESDTKEPYDMHNIC